MDEVLADLAWGRRLFPNTPANKEALDNIGKDHKVLETKMGERLSAVTTKVDGKWLEVTVWR